MDRDRTWLREDPAMLQPATPPAGLDRDARRLKSARAPRIVRPCREP
jgi:hypothetical protein